MVACQLYLDEQLEQPPSAESVADEIVQSAVECGGSQVRLIAQQVQTRGPAGPSLSEVLGSSAALPEAQTVKKGGSTFDTLNGNVLAR